MNTLLLLYASVDGQTLKICNSIADNLKEKDVNVEVFEISKFKGNLLNYSSLIIGASIRYGKHHKAVSNFIDKHIDTLRQMKTAFFSVNLVARKIEKSTFDTNPYVIKFFEKQAWRPDIVDVFAGKLDYQSYSFLDSLMIKLIMKMTKGPTKTEKPLEFTDWNRVEAFTESIHLEFQ
ncbi:menaquinone-dependent protoporphyrinogen IX dehydrogenase [Aestuariibaculum sp. YM273]|uniref:menaquinone-dependent protoporphyrinogen IX dehydrogenase n=1 Tax=Aestuariibaculum sp. YM273 TaxID=3070659 RepID=UPI0027DC25D2|nr:menaquinone-dependent protoporphyrinogen IX dehydrogenase [Aestuariibaculum sp. YM273]WMI65090.1 menaquinone-dependent protoporphyrinogen IX dehydrogenase [Aestuariibaculum sp. YM273]